MRIEKHFLAGIARGLAYYAGGFALVWITYLIFGWEYTHAPGLHHMVGLLVLVIGAILLIRRLIEVITNPRNNRNKGALLIHGIAVVSFILFFKLIILNGAIKRDTGEPIASKSQPVESHTKTRNTYSAQPR
jgi:membrane-bound ClpP family serine protease